MPQLGTWYKWGRSIFVAFPATDGDVAFLRHSPAMRKAHIMMEKTQFRIKTKLVLTNQLDFFGPGIAKLLHKIDEEGSIASAALKMEMSYSKAWNLLRKAEQGLGFPLIDRNKGGNTRGSSQLTEEGREFLEKYDQMQEELIRFGDDLLMKHMKKYL